MRSIKDIVWGWLRRRKYGEGTYGSGHYGRDR